MSYIAPARAGVTLSRMLDRFRARHVSSAVKNQPVVCDWKFPLAFDSIAGRYRVESAFTDSRPTHRRAVLDEVCGLVRRH